MRPILRRGVNILIELYPIPRHSRRRLDSRVVKRAPRQRRLSVRRPNRIRPRARYADTRPRAAPVGVARNHRRNAHYRVMRRLIPELRVC